MLEALPAYFQDRLEPAFRSLVDAAAASGKIRADVDCDALLGAIASLSLSAYLDCPETQSMVGLLLIIIVPFVTAMPTGTCVQPQGFMSKESEPRKALEGL